MSTPAEKQLRKSLSARAVILVPGDKDYPAAITLVNLIFDQQPAFVVKCATDGDVAATIRFARELGVQLSVRSGGASPGGYSSNNGGVMLHLGFLDSIEVDQLAMTATVGTGVILQELYERLGPTGLMVPVGECLNVGIGGITLGGGISIMGRSLGLTLDNLLSATVVTADGTVVSASESEHPELFWGLRGAGAGNFGVVTSMMFRLHPIPASVAFAQTMWPLDSAVDVLTEALQWYESEAPDAVGSLFSFFQLPGTTPTLVMGMLGVYNGPSKEGTAILQRLTNLRPPLLKSSRSGVMPFYQLIGGIPDGPPGPPQLHDYYRCGFVTGAFPRDGAELLVERFRQAPQMGNQKIMNMVMFELPSGVINKVAPEVTAFVHRDASSLLSVCATWYDPEKTGSMPEQEWADTLHADLSKYLNGGVYQNYVNRDLEDWGKAYYGMNLPRLRLVKRAYDPDNVFRYPQGIAAA